MDHWSLEKRVWDRNFFPSERIVWVDIEGLPLSAWSKDSFRKILAKWGSIAQMEDDLGEDVYKNRVCILTTSQNIISDTVRVRVDGNLFNIIIKEAPIICSISKLKNALIVEILWWRKQTGRRKRVKKMVFIMDGCFEHVQSVIEGEGNKKIKS